MARPAWTGGFEVSASMNATPMIDVMLVLLIVFMVLTPAMALPPARTAAPEREDRVTVRMDLAGRLHLDDHGRTEAVPAEQLAARLAAAFAARPGDHTLYLEAPEGVGYAHVLSTLDAARQAGVHRVGALTAPPRGARSHPGQRR